NSEPSRLRIAIIPAKAGTSGEIARSEMQDKHRPVPGFAVLHPNYDPTQNCDLSLRHSGMR
ncbi:hypothetical protein QIG23_28140, partial [Klebsiella pneumoniae]|nr:hypothetical protein [Klebsiella pneumoniae]